MFENLYPDVYVKSTFDIDYEKLYDAGFRGLIFDIDNTLVHHDAPADERSVELFKRLKNIGFACCFVSNNGRERVDMFNENIGVYAVVHAKKPERAGYEKAMSLMGTTRENTAAIGDQIFTDVWGARRSGIPCIMVKKMYFTEHLNVMLKRIPEAPIRICYRIYRKSHASDVFPKNVAGGGEI